MTRRMLVLALLLQLGACSVAAMDYIQSFYSIQTNVVWPTPDSNPHNISSTFGPRIRSSCNCYDFHRGIDIHGEVGDRVLASYHGKVKKIATYSSGGLTVVLEHSFPEWTKLHPDKGSTKRWYTLYMHLDSLNDINVGETVLGGEHIAFLGESGSTVNPHLHHEVRVGTRCSLEWAENNPSSTCNTKGYDPHMHPMLIYPPAMFSPTTDYLGVELTQGVDKANAQDGIVLFYTPDDAANINRYVIDQSHSFFDDKSHTLDLNIRQGFDATSTALLDTPDFTKPYLSPDSFGYTASEWETHLVIPHEWIEDGMSVRVYAYDIWGSLVGTLDIPNVAANS